MTTRGAVEGAVLILAACVLFQPVSAQTPPFREVTQSVGLGGVWGPTSAWGDFNNDGYPDLLVGCSRLFRNSGPPDFRFIDSGQALSGAHGVFADVNNDGYLDLYCPAGPGGNDDHLWINQGPPDFRFVDRTDWDGDGTPNMTDYRVSIALGWGDFDLDGSIDAYVGSYERQCGGTPTICANCEPNTMWRGLGDGTFVDVSTTWGLTAIERAVPYANAGACVNGMKPCTSNGDCPGDTCDLKAKTCKKLHRPCAADTDCPGAPASDSCKTGVCARGISVGDYNNDGWTDIFVSDYRLDPNMLLRNDGAGHWTEVGPSTGTRGHCEDGVCGHSLGSDWGDMDNDGDLDLYTANLAHWWGILSGHDIPYLWQNNNAGATFTDVRSSAGLRTSWNAYGQVDAEEGSAGWADFDNDGDLDLYVTGFYPFVEHWSTMYRNDGDKNGDNVPDFTDISDPGGADACPGNPANTTVGPTCLKRWYSWTAVWADYDRDGDLDLLTSGNPKFNQCNVTPKPPDCGSADPANRDTWPQPAYVVLFRNMSMENGSGGHWLEVHLGGHSGANRAAIGARVTVEADSDGDGTLEQMLREVSGGQGYESSQGSMVLHFGLGQATRAASVAIRWPNLAHTLETFTNIEANRVLTAGCFRLLRGNRPEDLTSYVSCADYPYTDSGTTGAPILFYALEDDSARVDVTKDGAGNPVITLR